MLAMLCNMAHVMSQALSGATLRLFRPRNLPFSWLKLISLCARVLEMHCNCGLGFGSGNGVIKHLSPCRITCIMELLQLLSHAQILAILLSNRFVIWNMVTHHLRYNITNL